MHLINEDCVCSKHNQEQLIHNLCFFYYFFQKSLFTENYFLIAATNQATRGPLYTCLVLLCCLSLFVLFYKETALKIVFLKHLDLHLDANSGCAKCLKMIIVILQLGETEKYSFQICSLFSYAFFFNALNKCLDAITFQTFRVGDI